MLLQLLCFIKVLLLSCCSPSHTRLHQWLQFEARWLHVGAKEQVELRGRIMFWLMCAV